ncbi:MAG: hypothetical protein DIJKHBIC_03660 [Thermoanaerobaculia bacterium]|nr:hypothetical protein [Thermoanaerobaculia bacterium]
MSQQEADPALDDEPARSRPPGAVWGRVAGIIAGLFLFGVGARIYFLFLKPLWADEIFTLWLARLDLGALLSALKLDSGPPLHYLVSKAVLSPTSSPGSLDILVRLPSLLASLGVMGLLIYLGKRMGRPETGWLSALLYAVSPLAVFYAAEGRAYALTTFLCLLVFERCLALGEKPTPGKAVVLGVLVALAFLSHYLSLFVLAGIGGAFTLRHRDKMKLWLVSAAVAAICVAPWLPILAGQPRAAMDWEREEPFSARAGIVLANVMTGVHADGAATVLLLVAATVLLGLLFWRRKELPAEPVGAFLMGFLLLLLGALLRPELLLPERSAVLFLPLVFLSLAALGRVPVAGLVLLMSGFLAFQGRTWTRPLPIQQLSEKLIPAFRDQHLLVVAGIWGPEIRYWFERAGLGGRVRLFPAELEKHPGWYSEAHLTDADLRREAVELLKAAAAPDVLVLPIGYRASDALVQAATALPSRRIAATPLFEILELQPSSGRPDGLPHQSR